MISYCFKVHKKKKNPRSYKYIQKMAEDSAADKNVEMWKIKKLIRGLEAARG